MSSVIFFLISGGFGSISRRKHSTAGNIGAFTTNRLQREEDTSVDPAHPYARQRSPGISSSRSSGLASCGGDIRTGKARACGRIAV
jgi:hypothetical protein